jgi:surface antigen
MNWQRTFLASVVAALFSVGLIAPAFAEPPPWAPAHGWRAKHHQHNEDEDEDEGRPVYAVPAQPVYSPPYGIAQNTCYRSAVGALIGAGAGAYAGNQVGKGGGKIAATIGGGILGALVGGTIGHWMDQTDQGCVGQVLEHAQTGQAVQWTNPDNGAQYAVTPVKTYQAQGGGYCREYTAQATVAGRPQQTYGTACRQPDGSWQIVN